MNINSLYQRTQITGALREQSRRRTQKVRNQLTNLIRADSYNGSRFTPVMLKGLRTGLNLTSYSAKPPSGLSLPLVAKYTPSWINRCLSSAGHFAAAHLPYGPQVVGAIPPLRAGLHLTSLAYGALLAVAVGCGPSSGDSDWHIEEYGVLGLPQLALYTLSNRLGSPLLSKACLLAATAVALPLELGRLVVFAGDEISGTALGLAIGTLAAAYNVAREYVSPAAPPSGW